MSNANLIRKLSRRKITLPAATEAARAAGDIDPDGEVTILIRKVRAGEVTARVGIPPRLMQLAADRRENETKEEQHARIEQALLDDPELAVQSQRQQDQTVLAVIAAGVVEPKVELDATDDDTLSPEDFGPDLDYVHDEIVRFSSLPYALLGAEELTTFPEERMADRSEPDGAPVRVPTE